MSGSKRVVGAAKSRHVRAIKMSPVARAVRSALAISATTLALAGSGMAYAGACSPSAPNTIYCSGAFTDTITFPDADLTLILGGGVPTSVTPPAGNAGVEASWPGAVTVVSAADITTSGADGIHAYGSDSATVTNTGDIYTAVTAAGASAMDINAYGDVGVANSGGAIALGNDYDVTTIRAESIAGDVQISNQAGGLAVAYSVNGDAIGIGAYSAAGSSSVGNDGTIYAISTYGLADGIFATGTNVDVANTGNIIAGGYSWAAGIEAQGSDLTTVTNAGTINATSTGASSHAFGVYATGNAGGLTIDNSGPITALGSYATGIDATAGGDIAITNSGDISAGDGSGYYATGVHAANNYPGANIAVDNSGNIQALSYYGSTGIEALATGTGGTASVSNSGNVYATTIYARYVTSTGIVASGDGGAQIDNTGLIVAAGGGSSFGAQALAFNGLASVSNSGEIDATSSSSGYAFGIMAAAQNGSASVDNAGLVQADGMYAYGVLATSSGDATIINNADGSVQAVAQYGYAFGLAGIATQGDVSITSAGDVQALGLNEGIGILANARQGDAAVNNSGNIYAYSALGTAAGVFARANNGTVAVDNSGAIAAYSYYGSALGIAAFGADTTVANSGSVTAYSQQGSARGIYGHAGVGDVNIDNSGQVTAYSQQGNAIALDGYAASGDVSIVNSGDVTSLAPSGNAIGIYGYSATGDVSISNAGAITVESGVGLADGIFASGASVNVANTGSIDATGYSWAAGIEAQGSDLATITNDGVINATSTGSYSHAFGVYATGGAVGVSVVNNGSITALGSYATGIDATAGGTIGIINAGDITVGDGASSYYGVGIHAANNYPGAGIVVANSGNITADSVYGSTGIEVIATGSDGAGSASNTGHIEAFTCSNYGVTAGIAVSADGDAHIDNAGVVTGAGGRSAYGAQALAFNGQASVTNSGDISATSSPSGYAYGILAASQNGSASVENAGSVYAGGNYAYGVLATAGVGDVLISNDSAGSVYAYSGTNFAIGVAGIATQGDVSITSAGDIQAVAYGPPDIFAGGTAVGIFGRARQGDSSVNNSGDIDVATDGTGFGIFTRADNGIARVDNSGTILTSLAYVGAGIFSQGATADVNNSGSLHVDAYHSYGIKAVGSDLAVVNNSGAIQATSQYTEAFGIFAQGDITNIENSGSIDTFAVGSAWGIRAEGSAHVTVHNTGMISATAGGFTTGLEMRGDGDVTLVNSGSISAERLGEEAANAVGVDASAIGPVLIVNSGDISATQADGAIAVYMHSETGSTLRNTGNVFVVSPIEGRTAVLGSHGMEHVLNYGNIRGALYLQGGDDMLLNGDGGVWAVEDHSTDFGAGDDTIHNAVGGTIVLDNAAIAMGSSTSVGNTFLNEGVIRVRGDSLIDMGSGVEAGPSDASLVPSLNPLPLTNNGVIDFVDGAPDDILTIQGDLGGHGAINLDVSALNHASDLLYVDGSTVNGTAQTVNVAFNGRLSTAQATPVPFAYVTGNSSAGAFVGGGIIGFNNPGDFLDLKVDVTSQIDASNATPDVFSVGVQALGLNDNGVLAASIASGAQSLVNSQIGTWRQRMGVLPPNGKIGLSPWVRVFGDNGDISPDHVANNFGQGGNFDFRQSNTGYEVGLDTRPAEHLNVGLLLSKSDGRQTLNKPGSGTDDFSANTFGLFGTWIGDNGFYLDASYRWTAFDARLRSQGINRKASGQVGSFNVEAGFNAWTLPGNVTVQPQAQYTRSEVTDIHPLQGELADFQTKSAVSSRGRLGVAFTKVIDRSGLVWTPYGSVNAVREFDGEYNFAINNDFSGATSTRGTSALVELGLGMRKDNFSITGGVNWADGGALQSFVGGQLVARYSW